METGQKTIQATNSLKLNTNKKLSIQISLSGLSFCILDTATHTIEHIQRDSFKTKATPFEVLERLKTVFETNTIFSQDFDSVLLIYQNELSNLVPKGLFNEQNSADYLKFNAKILKTDYISFDTITSNDSVNVYVPLVNINNYVFDKFGAFEYKHAATILIETLLKDAEATTASALFINTEVDHFEIIVIDNGQLILYNTFEYKTKEDFIYYILFTFEQLQLDPETQQVILSGHIEKEDSLYKMIYRYVRHVDFIKTNYNYKFSASAIVKQIITTLSF